MKRKVFAALLAAAMAASTMTTAMAADKTQLNVATEICNSQQITWELNASWFVVRWGVGECLVKNGDDGSYQPWLATEWSVADDDLTWTFKLRDDVKFSNGNPMTATSVKESIEYVYANDENKDINSFMEYSEITADDEAGTITIVTTKPTPDMPGVMAYPMMTVFDVAATTADGRDPVLDGIIATGPYAFTSFTQDHDVQLAKNEYYYGEVPFETVNIQIMSESSNRLAALMDGSADMAINVASADRNILAADPNMTISLVSGARTGFYHMNMNGVLGNENLRRAVLMAYDNETVCNISTQGSYTPGYTMVSPGLDFGGAEIEDATPFDVEAANALLDEAGIVDSDGNGIRELDGTDVVLQIKTQTNRQMDVMSAAIAENLKAINIGAEVIPYTAQSDELAGGQFDLGSTNNMIIPTGDPTNSLRYWYSTSGNNFSGYNNPEFDAKYDELTATMDIDTRKALIKDLQEMINKDAAVLVGGYFNFNICGNANVSGVHNPTCDFYWITADIVPEV